MSKIEEEERLIQNLINTFNLSNTNTNDPHGSSTRSNSDKNIILTSIQRTLRTLNPQISSLLTSQPSIFASNNLEAFLETIDDLIATINSLESIQTNQTLVTQSESLLQKRIHQLELEFLNLMKEHLDDSYQILNNEEYNDADDNEILTALPIRDYDIIVDMLPPSCISDLNKIAKRMVSAGFGNECVELYIRSRQDFLQESLERLGFSSLIGEEINSIEWAKLELEITRWVPIFNTVFRILIPSERLLCDCLFEGLDPFGDIAFVGASRQMALELISFAHSIASASRVPQCLFRILDMYESACGLLPEIVTIFCDEYSAQIYAEVDMLCGTIRNSIKGIFMEFENLIRCDPPGNPVPGGQVHPITRYVMNYLKTACGWCQTLEEVITSTGSKTGPTFTVDPHRPSSSLAVNFTWIMDNLQKNVEAKSKVYLEPDLAFIFLMNNGRYILNKVKDCELCVILGDDWIKQMNGKISRWVKSYLNTWTQLAYILDINDEALMLDRLRDFNKYIEENFRVQSEWIIVDEQIMTELRTFIVAILLPVYRTFLVRVRGIAGRRERDMLVKFSPEELEARIDGLFQLFKKG